MLEKESLDCEQNALNIQENSHRLLWADTDNRHIISMKSRGFSHTPQDIMEEYNGYSVPQYTRYPLTRIRTQGGPSNSLFSRLSR